MKNYKEYKKESNYTAKDISSYSPKLTDEQTKILLYTCNKYNIHPVTIAYYNNIDEFFADWS